MCTYSNYGTLRQLALDTIGNLAAQFILDPVDSFKSKTILSLLVQCITASDKFSVVTGLFITLLLHCFEQVCYSAVRPLARIETCDSHYINLLLKTCFTFNR